MNTRRLSFAAALLFWAILLSVSWSSATPEKSGKTLIEFGGRSMGTTYTVKLTSRRGVDRRLLAAEVAAVLESVDRTMSTYRSDSEISRFNSVTSTEWVEISAPFGEVLREALHWSLQTDGAFDPTAGPLVNLWGFGPEPVFCRVPGEALIERERKRVGYQLLEIRSDPPAVRKKRPGVLVDLSAIAKGHAVDRVFGALVSRGVSDCLVEIGGELRGLGSNARGQPWAVAIENPVVGRAPRHHRIRLSPGAVATSGDYRNFFLQDGVKYSHILDPRTGRPVPHELASVTVIDSTAARADAIATALMVLGPEQGYDFAVRKGIAALFLVRNGDVLLERTTHGFESHLVEE